MSPYPFYIWVPSFSGLFLGQISLLSWPPGEVLRRTRSWVWKVRLKAVIPLRPDCDESDGSVRWSLESGTPLLIKLSRVATCSR